MRDKLKVQAYTQLRRAVRNGVLIRPGSCSECQKAGLIHGHHEDYTKPLEVEWLCPRCHRAKHPRVVRDRGPKVKLVRTNFDLSPQTIERIEECRRLLSKGLGIGRMSKRQVVELAIYELYKNNQWREDDGDVEAPSNR